MGSHDEGKVKPTTVPTAVSFSSQSAVAAASKDSDFTRFLRDNHPGHDLQRMGTARVNPGVLGISQKGKQGTLEIWFCGTDGQVLYDLA